MGYKEDKEKVKKGVETLALIFTGLSLLAVLYATLVLVPALPVDRNPSDISDQSLGLIVWTLVPIVFCIIGGLMGMQLILKLKKMRIKSLRRRLISLLAMATAAVTLFFAFRIVAVLY